jgi:O-antigen/teichoic acid export membrane protein
LTSAANLGFSVALSLLFSKTAFFWLLGQIISQSIIAAIAWQYFNRITCEERNKDWWKCLPKASIKSFYFFTLPLALTALFYWAQTQSYRLIVEHYAGLAYLALLGVGFGLSSRISSIVESLVQQYFYPIYLKRIASDKMEERTRAWFFISENTIPVYLAFTIFISFIAPYLTNILVAKNFQNAFLFLIFGVLIDFFRMITGVIAAAAHSEMKTSYLLVPNIAGGLLATVGVYFSAQIYGIDYLIPATLVFCGLITTSIMYFFMKKLLPLRLNYRKIVFSICLSIPFCLTLLFGNLKAPIWGLAVVFFFGLYFLLLLRILYSRFLSQKVMNQTI